MTVWAAALAITAGACNTADRGTPDYDATATSVPGVAENAQDRSPMTLTGCLQQGDGNDFILTQASEQPGPVGTTGDSGDPAIQQRQAAAHSYRLSGGPDNLRDLVGHQVRVSGTLEERGDVQAPGSEGREGEISQDDLAELEVTSAQSVANTCGAGR